MQQRTLVSVLVGSMSLAACGTGGRREVSVEAPDENVADAVEASLDAPAPDVTAPDSAPDVVSIDAPLDAIEASVDAPVGPETLEAAVEACPVRGFTRCAGTCVDISANAEHCGGCGMHCVAGANATAECVAAECDRGCAAGFGDCDTDTANGCEAALNTVMHCGACGRACAAGQVCSGGMCAGFSSLPAPVPMAPLSGARVGKRRPTLRWTPPAGTSYGAELQLCRDRACTPAMATTVMVSASRYVPTEDLEPRTYFWRVRLRDGATASDRWSPVWQFRVVPEGVTSEVPVGFDADFNGDGRSEVVVGAPQDNMFTGGVYVYYGAAGGPASTTPSWSARLDPAGGPDDELGRAMVAADINGDGFVDLVASNPGSSFLQGRLYIYFGSAGGLATTPGLVVAGAAPRSSFGMSLGTVGDANADGLADLLVGASNTRYGEVMQAGAAFVLQAPRPGALPAEVWATRETMVAHSNLGFFVASLGDTDGDGWPDTLVNAIGEDAGRAYAQFFLGGASGYPALPSVRYDEPMPDTGFGDGLSATGDVDGDGYADALLRANYTELSLLRGGTGGLSRTPSQRVTTAGGFGMLGEGFGAGDDVNGDGRTDVVLTGGCGAVLYFGAATGFTTTGAVRLSDTAGNEMGMCMSRTAMQGDVDGDGIGDFVVSSEMANENRGGVFLYLGSREGVRPRAVWGAVGPGNGSRYGESLLR